MSPYLLRKLKQSEEISKQQIENDKIDKYLKQNKETHMQHFNPQND